MMMPIEIRVVVEKTADPGTWIGVTLSLPERGTNRHIVRLDNYHNFTIIQNRPDAEGEMEGWKASCFSGARIGFSACDFPFTPVSFLNIEGTIEGGDDFGGLIVATARAVIALISSGDIKTEMGPWRIRE